jgi:hypothetical protein
MGRAATLPPFAKLPYGCKGDPYNNHRWNGYRDTIYYGIDL